MDFVKDPIGQAADRVYGLVHEGNQSEFKDSVSAAMKTIEECFDRFG